MKFTIQFVFAFLPFLWLYSCNHSSEQKQLEALYQQLEAEQEAEASNFVVYKGQDYFEENILDVKIKRERKGIKISLNITLNPSIEFPFVDSSIANHLHIKAVVETKDSTIELHTSQGEAESQPGHYTDGVYFNPEHLAKIAEGKQHLKVKIKAIFQTENKHLSNLTAFETTIGFDYEVPAIYQSTLHFKRLAISESVVKEMDLYDGWLDDYRPDAGIEIFVSGEFLHNRYTHGRFVHEDEQEFTIYHSNPHDTITFKAFDGDFFFNQGDYIAKINKSINDLINDDYLNLKTKHIDELLVYCSTEGQLNKN